MGGKGISIFMCPLCVSGSAPDIYIHDLIYSPQEAYKVDFVSR